MMYGNIRTEITENGCVNRGTPLPRQKRFNLTNLFIYNQIVHKVQNKRKEKTQIVAM